MSLRHEVMSILHDVEATHERETRRTGVVHYRHNADGAFAMEVLSESDVIATHQNPSPRTLLHYRATSAVDLNCLRVGGAA